MVLLQAGGQSSWQSMIFLVGIFVVFYFFMIRPQQKKQKDQKKFRENMKKGDQVVTIGGVFGKIVEINDGKVVIDVDRGTKLTLDKNSISNIAE